MLERALTAIAKEQNALTPQNSHALPTAKAANKSPDKAKKAKFTPARVANRLYLPEGEYYQNPEPRSRTKDRSGPKWPKGARWVCPYCRLILFSVKRYKAHINYMHTGTSHISIMALI